ncbi:cysteine desulfurase [Clostridia bacterium]|nr:cysteine desulfurase [Clostridia bacterium]
MIYFDNAATTPPLPFFPPWFGNPSSLHEAGIRAEGEIRKATGTLLSFAAQNGVIVYTSGATEANNTAIFGSLRKHSGKHVITTNIEHPSVVACFQRLEGMGYEVTYLPAAENGCVSEAELSDAVRPDTALVSIFYVHNELGAVHDIRRLAEIVHGKNKDAVFHTDAVQAFGKIKTDFRGVDLVTFCGHKIHGAKGIGALLLKNGIRVDPIFFGGGQQGGLRAGTENVEGILSLANAAKHAYENLDSNFQKVKGFRDEFLKISEVLGLRINCEDASPYILNISIPNVKGEILLNALSAEGICVSTGSACHGTRDKKNVLRTINPKYAENALRVSFSYMNTMEEVYTLKEAVLRGASNLSGIRRR